MLILGIETTCDETACAIVRDGRQILSNVVASQHDIHEIYGGVFPELASRRHAQVIIPVLEKALSQATNLSLDEIDGIAVAKGPGLIGSLIVGMNTAKALAIAHRKPFVGVNHVEAHLYAAMMQHPTQNFDLPALGVVVSGGHTFMLKIHDVGSYQMIGTTVDDAIGEAFDKVATLLGLPYPGGPSLEKLALKGDPLKYSFKPGKVKNQPYDFSFSGIKTNVLYTLKNLNPICSNEEKKHIAASFQDVVLRDILNKSLKAAQDFNCKALFVGGGVSQNQYLRRLIREHFPIPQFWPEKDLCLDNAAMIAGLGYHQLLKNPLGDALELSPITRIPFQDYAHDSSCS